MTSLDHLGFIFRIHREIAIATEHRPHELYLEILLDEGRCIHTYLLVTFEEKNKKQRKFR